MSLCTNNKSKAGGFERRGIHRSNEQQETVIGSLYLSEMVDIFWGADPQIHEK